MDVVDIVVFAVGHIHASAVKYVIFQTSSTDAYKYASVTLQFLSFRDSSTLQFDSGQHRWSFDQCSISKAFIRSFEFRDQISTCV